MARRGIPPLRPWRVKLWDALGIVTHATIVDAINRDFAYYNALQKLGRMPFYNADRVTISPVRGTP